MSYKSSILFTRPLSEGEGAAIQEQELDRLISNDVSAKEEGGWILTGFSVLTEFGNGAIKVVVLYQNE